MPVLNWIGKEAVVNHDKEVPFRLLKKIKSASVGENSQNLIIHGDNLEALKTLMSYYAGKIKCIYIDPPYNTGNEGWVYNDKVNSPKIKKWLGKVVGPESEDLSRHDKWLCMMYPRLKLLRDLLSDDGVIFVSIDDNEQGNLRLVLDEIFGEDNFIANVAVYSNPRGRQSTNNVALTHEYVIIYAKSSELKLGGEQLTEEKIKEYNKEDEKGRYREIGLRLRGGRATAEMSPTLHFPLFVNPNTLEIVTEEKSDYVKVVPKFENGVLGTWRWSKKKINNEKEYLIARLVKEKNGNQRWDIFEKDYLSSEKTLKVKSLWADKEINYDNGAREISELFGKKVFQYSKPIGLITKILKIGANNNSLILDSFAGSGTTGQAVLDLNKEDGGNRKFILVELEDKVARDITAERVKRAIKKYNYKDGFEFCELDKPLFDQGGQIDKDCTFEQLATYIYFTETKTNINKNTISKEFIGFKCAIFIYLLFNSIGKNILDREFIKKIKNNGKTKIIYADKCLVDERILEKNKILFKQIPYEVKIY
ncbi:site-specific DNA-methyltransferase [Candidatus Parvarchaeota archaeon]|nr:site-specific DNA-methyltransferase [Candidatus Parvarchaeota archaeon]